MAAAAGWLAAVGWLAAAAGWLLLSSAQIRRGVHESYYQYTGSTARYGDLRHTVGC
jgi:hypothetical protein